MAREGIGWGALSGLASGADDDTAYAVPDDSFAPSRIYSLDISREPAVITDEAILTDGAGTPVSFDPEGLATRLDDDGKADPDEGWWLSSEGDPAAGAAGTNLLAEVEPDGTVVRTVGLPPAVMAGALRWGFEGVTVTGTAGSDSEQVYVAFQREWVDDAPGLARLGRYTPSTDRWAFFAYPLEQANPGNEVLTLGVSELVALDDTSFAVIERDSAAGAAAAIKRIYRFSIDGVEPTPCAPDAISCQVADSSVVTDKRLVADLLAEEDLRLEKVEGLVVLESGEALVVTDNDGAGETRLLRLKRLRRG